ncbi:GreA/GreB family elongation factor [Flavobacterium sp. '19STA2R22 D10 B1']|uniref:GreA/GreB family elongation factor n=1 Tax=Flavobacterium aerium TaxID=3037261 RepID=UPI00278C2BA5|nr:GreA/GreB family elongation factor [Flavobacterium sp. '19STA2R22 D10 B1']
MKNQVLIIEKKEFKVIEEILSKAGAKDAVHEACYAKLKKELETAEIRTEAEMPKDVVRLNSIIDIQTPAGLKEGYQLVIPTESNPAQKKLSILMPMGSALIGYAEGDKIMWSFPNGEQEVVITKVVQP